jgi:hypothetical protein
MDQGTRKAKETGLIVESWESLWKSTLFVNLYNRVRNAPFFFFLSFFFFFFFSPVFPTNWASREQPVSKKYTSKQAISSLTQFAEKIWYGCLDGKIHMQLAYPLQ